MRFLNATSYGKAKLKIIDRLERLNKTLRLSLLNALGKTVAEDIAAPNDLPFYNKSVADGYAVKASDTYGAGECAPAVLRIVGAVEMGAAPALTVNHGEAVKIPTGGMLPSGADCVVMLEHVNVFSDCAEVFKGAAVYENVLKRGADVEKDRIFLNRGRILSALDIGLLAALGIPEIRVFDSLSLFIISTGDELTDIDSPTLFGKTRDSNGVMLEALAAEAGFKVLKAVRVKDDFDELKTAVSRGIKTADIVVVSGGSSVGEKDFTAPAIEAAGGGIFIEGVALKPGKPSLCAEAFPGGRSPVLIFGLPGHPAASAAAFKLLIQNTVTESRGGLMKAALLAEAACNFPSSPGRFTLQPVRIENANGRTLAYPAFGKSGSILPSSESDGYILLSEIAEGIEKGCLVDVFRW